MAFFENKHQIAVQPMFQVGCLSWLMSLHKSQIIPGIAWTDQPSHNHFLSADQWNQFFQITDKIVIAANSKTFRNINFHRWLAKYKPKYIEIYNGLSGDIKKIGTAPEDDVVIKLMKSIGAKIILKNINNKDFDIGYATMLASMCDAVNVKNKKAAGYTNHQQTLQESIEWAKARYSKPVIASGGLCNKQDINEALSYGADAVMIGTVFAVAEESNLSREAKDLLVTKTINDLQKYGSNEQSALKSGELISNDDGNMNKNLKNLVNLGNDGIVFAGHGIESISSIRPIKDIVKDLLI